MTEPKAPREFWIELHADPSDNQELYKRYSAAKPFDALFVDSEVIHMREVTGPNYKSIAEGLMEAMDWITGSCVTLKGVQDAAKNAIEAARQKGMKIE